MKKLVLFIVVFAALGAVVWFGLRSKPAPDGKAAGVATEATNDSPAPEATSQTPRAFRHRDRSKSDATASDPMDVWDKQIDAILESKATDAEIADQLLELYPRVPAEGQADLILEIATRIASENYSKLSNIMTNAASSEEVVETLLTDLIDRPDKIRLPLLLDLARIQENPKSGDAHDLLEVLLGEDYGNNWDQWSKKISEWLASHPE